jgi:hypothetical protein
LQLFFHLGVQERNAGVALNGSGIALPESIRLAGGGKKRAGVYDQALDIARGGGRLFSGERFIDLDQQRSDGPQPLKPCVVDQKLQERGRRGNRTVHQFLGSALGIEQRLVQREKSLPKFR